jgi:hypothetical protein
MGLIEIWKKASTKGGSPLFHKDAWDELGKLLNGEKPKPITVTICASAWNILNGILFP